MSSPLFSHALLVEDEPAFARVLLHALHEMNIPVRHAADLREARKILKSQTVDLILLDRNLPDGDGLSLLSQLPSARPAVLVLSARGELDDRVTGLNQGADDYLPKPFRLEEFEARLKAIARRVRPIPETPQPLWTIDLDRSRVFGPRGWQELTPLELKFFRILSENADKIVPRRKLLTEVWGMSLLTRTRSVDQFLARLRKYFELHPEDPQHFLTYRGQGYLFKRG